LLELIKFVSKKKILPRVDSVYELSEVQKAHTMLESRQQLGKILIKI
jgi:NADPH:quinone reductase-like Zn-dependent oxidoreductase